MKKILAVSGGIDSMVMLDIFAQKNTRDLIVAHFNHGTRESARLDEEFVQKRCHEYDVDFISGKKDLGEGVSEEKARQARYDFLYHVANKYKGEIYTAHHLNDLLESITINLLRGTGWRGLTPLVNPYIRRPLIELGFFKTNTLQYATEHAVRFRQDPSNSSNLYLRNRIRDTIRGLSEEKQTGLLYLNARQLDLRKEIERILQDIILQISYKIYHGENKNESNLADLCFLRDIFHEVDEKVGIELLKTITDLVNMSLTRPQLFDFLHAIKNYRNGKKFNLPKDKMAKIDRNIITIEV